MEQQETTMKEIDFSFYIRHYLNLLWRWKFYILAALPTISVLATFAIIKLGLFNPPPLPATVLIGLDNKSTINTLADFSAINQNKERLLLNRDFLEKAITKLSLQLIIPTYSRYDIFDSVKIQAGAFIGTYRFKIDKFNSNIYTVTFLEKNDSKDGKIIKTEKLSSLNNLEMTGIYLKFASSFLLAPHDFSFSIIPMRNTIDMVLSRMKVTSPNPREQTYYFSATLEGTDYPLVSQTINTIADLFIESNLNMRKRRVKESIIVLEKQLAAAEQQLNISKSELKSFLGTNTGVGLKESTRETMTELIALESNSLETGNLIGTAENLKVRFLAANNEDKLPITDEIIVFLQMKGNLAASLLQSNLNQFITERTAAEQSYSKSHPVFLELEKKYLSIQSRTLTALDSYIMQLKKNISDRKSTILRISDKLQGLPSKELQLAELQHRQEIDSEIYTTILAKYNETRVAESVDDADVFIMDYAVQPIPPSSFMQLLKAVSIIFGLVMFVSFSPPVFFDYIDKTARSEKVLRKLLPYRFLETIPVIKIPAIKSTFSEKDDEPSIKRKQTSIIKRKLLITEKRVSPPFVTELFRSLISKIQLSLFDRKDKCILISSLDMNEGKSTIASNIALAFANNGIKTVLIDCDLRRGMIHKFFSLPKKAGLSDYILSCEKSDKVIQVPPPLQSTEFENLSIISSGSNIDNPQKLLHSPVINNLKEYLIQEGFFIVFDSPPIGITADAALLCKTITNYVFVIKAGQTNVIRLHKILLNDYSMINNNILGIVLNMGQLNDSSRYYCYY